LTLERGRSFFMPVMITGRGSIGEG
jgi:hypothetical protein